MESLGSLGVITLSRAMLGGGEYLVWPLTDFAGLSLRRDTPGASFSLREPHRTAKIKFFTGDWEFPLRAGYVRANHTLEGIETARGLVEDPLAAPPDAVPTDAPTEQLTTVDDELADDDDEVEPDVDLGGSVASDAVAEVEPRGASAASSADVLSSEVQAELVGLLNKYPCLVKFVRLLVVALVLALGLPTTPRVRGLGL